MRVIAFILGLAVLIGGGWLLWGSQPSPPTVQTQPVAHLAAAPPVSLAPTGLVPPPKVDADNLAQPTAPQFATAENAAEQTTASADPDASAPTATTPQTVAAAQPTPTPAASNLPPAAQAINDATLAAPGKRAKRTAYNPALLRAEVLLDRAGFSPGVIDGRDGDNVRHALTTYARAQGLTSDGTLDKSVWEALTAKDPAATMQGYAITAADAAGPFIGEPPKDYEALAKLPVLSYSNPVQLLAEKFHMDQSLLKALNPGATFDKAGATILVAAVRAAPRDFQAARIEVDKSDNTLRAYGADGKVLAAYPASVGSVERPAPSGVFAVKAVAPRPAYYYDPARLTFAPEGAKGKLKIAPGPNNPVGSTWIALTIETYGIHGSPDPTTIGKRQSHGCVRLTNWDAIELGRAVKKGVKVDFVGQEKPAGRKA